MSGSRKPSSSASPSAATPTAPDPHDSAELASHAETEARNAWGMRCLDTSCDTNVPLLMEMVGALSRAKEPQEVLKIVAKRWRQIRGPRGFISVSTRDLAPGEYRITRFTADTSDLEIMGTDSWSHPEKTPVLTGGIIGQIIRTAYPEVIYDLHVADDPVLGSSIASFRSLMAVPLFDDGEPLNWAIMLSMKAEGFSARDLEEEILRGNLIGGTVKNKLLWRRLKEANARIQREIDQIASIQRALLPHPLPRIAGLTLSATYETYDLAGGDYYDFVPLRLTECGEPDPEGPWVIVIADASGHGPAAAVVMAMLHAILHAHPLEPSGPAEVLEYANRHLCAKRIESSFVTAFLGVYDPKTRRFKYARAGHNPPLLKNPGAGGLVERLDTVGEIPLGIIRTTKYQEMEITLKPGQTVLLYTDGVTESEDREGRMFGLAGIEVALTACTGDPECVHGSLTNALREHEAGKRPDDDQTFVAFQVDGEETATPRQNTPR